MKTVTKVEVVEVEKRRIPSKHYVYVIFVTWSDGGTYVIYRRYSRFFDFQNELLDKFPIEAGTIDPEARIIPFLPGKIIFGRSHIRDVAVKRLGVINDYCKAVIALQPKISQCEEVLEFFEVEVDDLDPPKQEEKSKSGGKVINKISKPKNLKQYRVTSDYVKQDRGEIDLECGMLVEVVEKSETGWWFVNSEDAQGWVPSTYLQPIDGPTETVSIRCKPGQEIKCICIEKFESGGDDEISLEKGSIVEVLEKNLSGWWLVRHQGREGFAPATYLKKTDDEFAMSLAHRKSTDVEIITNLSDISNIMKNKEEVSENTLKPPELKPSSLKPTDTIHEKGPKGDKYTRVKTRSLERGGNLKPPPRQSVRQSTACSPAPRRSHYVTIAEFNDTVGDGLSFKEGQSLQVKEKSESGWWFVTIDDKDGWVPASYILSQASVTEEDDPSVYTTINEAEVTSEWSDEDNEDQPDPKLRKMSEKKPISLSIDQEIKNKVHNRQKNCDAEEKTVNAVPPKPPHANLKASNSTNLRTDSDNATDKGKHDLADILKNKFENRKNQFKDPIDNSSNASNQKSTKPVLPIKTPSTEVKPLMPPKLPKSKPTSEDTKAFSLSNKPIPKLPDKNIDKQSDTLKPASRPNSSAKPTIATKPKPALGVKPTLKQKPSLPTKPSAVNQPGGPSPPKLPAKKTVSACFDSNNNKDNERLSVGIQELQSKFENKNSAPMLPKHENKLPPKLPGKLNISNRKNTEPSQSCDMPNVSVPPKLPGKLNIPNKTNTEPPKLPGKLNIPNKTNLEQLQSVPPKLPVKLNISKNTEPKPSCDKTNTWTDSDKPKANVGNLVSALSGKLNFGGIPPSNQASNKRDSTVINHNSMDTSDSNRQKGSENNIDHRNNKHSDNRDSQNTKQSIIYIVIEPFESATAEELSVREGDEVKLCQETDSGWWLVSLNSKQGWVPSAYLVERRQTAPIEPPPVPAHASTSSTPKRRSTKIIYKTVALFCAENSGELGFDEGDTVDVIDKSDADWWMIRIKGEEGWAPRSFIEEVEVEDKRGSLGYKAPPTPTNKPAFKFHK